MENDASRVLYLIEKLRSITLGVQVAPFVFSALYIMTMILYLFASDSVCSVLDTMFYVSPTTAIAMLVFSKILKLCRWHKTACLLPVFPQVVVFVDYHIFEFTEGMARAAILIPALMAVLLLIAAWNVFLKPKNNERNRRKERTTRNP